SCKPSKNAVISAAPVHIQSDRTCLNTHRTRLNGELSGCCGFARIMLKLYNASVAHPRIASTVLSIGNESKRYVIPPCATAQQAINTLLKSNVSRNLRL